MARNFMTNIVNAFVGSLGTSGLLDRIDKCDGHRALRDLYDEWYHAIVMSRRQARGRVAAHQAAQRHLDFSDSLGGA